MTVPSVSLTKDGLKLSRLVYGVWRLHEDKEGSSPQTILRKIETCLELGIDSFDHADIYGDFGNEALFGKALETKKELKSKIKVITKCGIQIPGNTFHTKHYNTSSSHITHSVENSLKHLGLDKIDLLLIHRPDPLMDAEEISRTFLKLKKEGKVDYFGVSNFTVSQFRMLQSKIDIPLVTNQVEFNPFHVEPLFNGTFDLAQELGFSSMVWSPTAGGAVFSPKEEKQKIVLSVLTEIANKYEKTADQILYSWFFTHPSRLIPVLGTNDLNRIRSAGGSFGFHLTKEEWFRVLEAGTGKPVP